MLKDPKKSRRKGYRNVTYSLSIETLERLNAYWAGMKSILDNECPSKTLIVQKAINEYIDKREKNEII